jgi:hypothetical protein
MTSTAVEVISKAVATAFTNQVVPALSEWLKGKGAEVTTEDLLTFMTTNSVGGATTVPASQPKVPKIMAGVKTCIATRRKPIAGKCTNPAIEGSNYCRECRKTKKAVDEEGPVAPVPKKRATKDAVKDADDKEEGGEIETPEPAPTKAKKLPKVSDEEDVEPPHWEVVEAEQRLYKDLITGIAAVQDEKDPTVYRYCGWFDGDDLRGTLTKDEEKEVALRKLEKFVGDEEEPNTKEEEEDDEATEDEAPKPKTKVAPKPVSKAPVKKESEEKEEVEVPKPKAKAPTKKESEGKEEIPKPKTKVPSKKEPEEEEEAPKPKPKAPVKKEVKVPVKVPVKKEEEDEEEPEEVEEEKPQPIKKASTVKPPPMGGQKKDSKVEVPKNLPKLVPAGLGKGVPKKAPVVEEDEESETEE